MRKEYDFTNAKPNPYVKNLRKQISIRPNEELEAGYKAMAADEEYELKAMEWCNGLMNGIAPQRR